MKSHPPIRLRHAVLLTTLLPLFAFAATPAPVAMERQLDVRITMSGTQSWKNLLQYTEATTAQDYDFSVRLRSNGVLYSDNLVDTNRLARVEIKQEFYTRNGLAQLKAENGGKLPTTAAELTALADRARSRSTPCQDDFECNQTSLERFAAIEALKSSSLQEIEGILGSAEGYEEPRYLYFFGYPGCQNRIHVTYEVHIAGKRAYDRDRKKLVPFSIDRSANSPGSDADQKTLCERFVVTLDTKSGAFYVENLLIPAPPGTSVQNINGQIDKQERALHPPAVVLDWTSAKLRENKVNGHERAVLDLTLPLDADSTVLGDFTGKLNLDMSWSFKPVAKAPAPASR